MSSGGAWELGSGVGDDGRYSDNRGAGSIKVASWDVSIGEYKEDEVSIGDGDGFGGRVDEEVEDK